MSKKVKYQLPDERFANYNCIEIDILPDGRLDTKNAAKLIGVKPNSLSAMSHRHGMPPFTKIAGKLYYYYDDLIKWLKSHTKYIP